MKITPSMLFNYHQCPHKVWRDIYGPKEEEIQEVNPFVQLLWDKGVQHEKEIIQTFGFEILDLSEGTIQERKNKTEEAFVNKVKYIYQPVIENEELFGIPDILQLTETGEYRPIDIKSGSGFEGESDNGEQKQKKHYATQLCVYLEILISKGLCTKETGFIIDNEGVKVEYDLNMQISSRVAKTYWEYYLEVKKTVKELIDGVIENHPALSGVCKLCSWYTSCKEWCNTNNDLTQVFYLGRSVRDALKNDAGINNINDLLNCNATDLLDTKKKDKAFLKGIGENTLNTAIRRADMLVNNKPPVIYNKINFPEVAYELYFDIEDDPTQDFVYLHGLYVREPQGTYFKYFVTDSLNPESEKKAWLDFWNYIDSLPPTNYAVYYFSQHERTTYLRLQKKYPEVISEDRLVSFFDNERVIDLYGVVLKNTDWPLGSYSIKALATYSGFSWRDETPSGALSIQWFNEYTSTGEQATLTRILEYNEDDCKATMALKDKLVELQK